MSAKPFLSLAPVALLMLLPAGCGDKSEAVGGTTDDKPPIEKPNPDPSPQPDSAPEPEPKPKPRKPSVKPAPKPRKTDEDLAAAELEKLGAGIERTVRQLAAHAGTCLVVTTDEPTSVTDAYAFIKLSLIQNPEADLRIVVNMAETESDGHRTYATLCKACESFLKTKPPLAGIIRRDPKVKDSIRNQAPILTRHPSAPAAQDVEKLARRLVEAA